MHTLRLFVRTQKRNLILAGIFLCILGPFFLYSQLFGKYGLRNPFPFESVASYLRTEFLTCYGTEEYRDNVWRSDCYQELGNRVTAHFELPAALKGLAEIQDEPQIRGWCHAFGHVLGQREFKKTGSISQSFLACSTDIACGEGCFHGTLEGYLQAHGGAVTKEVIQNACKEEEAGNRVTYDACIHGLGHAAMLQTNNDIAKALPFCDYIADTHDQGICYTGVFMEDTFSFNGGKGNSTVDKDNPEYPCTELAAKYQHQCYASRSTFVLQQSRADYAKTSLFCNRIPPAFRTDCYGTFGAQAVLLSDDMTYVASVCSGIERAEDRESCFEQATIFKGFATGGDVQGYADLCNAAPEKDKAVCLALSGEDLARWYPGKRAEKCLMFTKSDSEEYQYCAGTKEILN